MEALAAALSHAKTESNIHEQKYFSTRAEVNALKVELFQTQDSLSRANTLTQELQEDITYKWKPNGLNPRQPFNSTLTNAPRSNSYVRS